MTHFVVCLFLTLCVLLPVEALAQAPGGRVGQTVEPTWDFETGNLRGWTPTGSAFRFQPTLGDNASVRKPAEPANPQGKYWIGTYESYGGSQVRQPGDIQRDEPRGTLTSATFQIPQESISFLIGGGASFETRVELRVMEPIEGWQRAYFASGNNNETMQRVSWDVSKWAGRTGQIRIVDDSSGPWGHINVDDFVFSSRRRDPIPPPAQQLEFSSDRTTVNPGEQVTFFLTPASAAAGFVYDISFSGEPSEVMEGAQAVHEYRKPGDYTVTVTPRPSAERPSPVIVDNFLKIRVQSVPLTHAPEPVYAGESVTFTIGSDDSSMRYRFHFEEGPPGEWSTAPQAKHTYENPGMYTVSASMSREGWAEPISTESTTVTVMQRPSTEVAGRTPDPATDTDPQVWPFILVGMAVAGVTGYKWFLSRRPMLIPVPDRVDSQLRRAPRIDLRIVASPGVESGNHTVKRLKILRISSLRRKNG